MALERHYLAVIDTRKLLCSSYVQLCIALEKAGIIKVQKGMFGTEEHRYAQRYECFQVFPQAVYIPFNVMQQQLDSGSALLWTDIEGFELNCLLCYAMVS